MTRDPAARPEPPAGRLSDPKPDFEQASGGFEDLGLAVIGPPILPGEHFAALRAEAEAQWRAASWPLESGDGRSRVFECNRRGHLGPAARQLMASPGTLRWLTRLTGRRVTPSWAASCYTYYRTPEAWLGRHRDHDVRCQLTMLLGLEAEWAEATPEGAYLLVYVDDRARAPLARIRTRPNRAIVLDGVRRPHERPPVGPQARITVLSACYTVES
jgi:hypothetical protein